MGLVSLGAMAGCEDDDRKSVRVPAAVQGAFGKMFPAASHVEWEDRGGYVVADFRSAGTVMQAWFDAAGKWHMTEEDISYAELPQAVRTAYEAGDYAAWHVDDVDKLQRNGQETVYVIEVEHAKQEFDLYYSEDGVLLREAADTDGNGDHGDMLPAGTAEGSQRFHRPEIPRCPYHRRGAGEGKYRGRYHLRRESARSVLRYGRRLAVDEDRVASFGDSGCGEAGFAVIAVRHVGDRRCRPLRKPRPRMVRLRHGRPAIRTGGDGAYPRGRHPALIVPHICTEPASLGAGPVFFVIT